MWEQVHPQMLTRLNVAGGIDWSRAVVDSISVRALKGDLTGPSPVDRGKPGSKIHILCDRRGIPLTVLLSAANTPDADLLFPLLDSTRRYGVSVAGPAGSSSLPVLADEQPPPCPPLRTRSRALPSLRRPRRILICYRRLGKVTN